MKEKPDIDPSGVSIDQHWFRFGVAIGFLQLVFVGVLLVLLQWDFTLALVFAVVVSVVSGAGIMAYVRRSS